MIIRPKRTDTANLRPPIDIKREGELYINRYDRQIGFHDHTGTPIDLLVIRPFVAGDAYKVNDLVTDQGKIYRAIRNISADQSTPGFNKVHWQDIATNLPNQPAIPPVTVGNIGQALVVDTHGNVAWGAQVSAPDQEIYGGAFPGGTSGVKIKIRSRLGPTALIGPPTTLAEGELAYNEAGLNNQDRFSGGALFIGNQKSNLGVNRVLTLVSSTRQVEVTGAQSITGVKTFTDSIIIGSGTAAYKFPLTIGAPGKVLKADTGGNVIWDDALHQVINKLELTGTNGSPEDNLNALPGGLVVGPDDFYVILDQESGAAYIWSGGVGSFGTAGGFPAATASQFAKAGSVVEIADAPEVQAGIGDKVIPVYVAATELFRTNFASGNQVVTAPITTFKETSPGSGGGEVHFESDITLGEPNANVVVTAFSGSTIRGSSPTDLLVLEDVLIDAGTF